MAPLASRMPKMGRLLTESARSENITPAPSIPWQLVGPARDHLLDQLNDMYWDGVKGELEVIIRTLRTWQQPQYESVVLNDENDDFVHGFDTFIDQVSQKSRAFAARYGMFAVKSSFDLRIYISRLTTVKANGRRNEPEISEPAIRKLVIRKPFSTMHWT